MFVLRPRPTDLARGMTRRRWLEVGLGGGALASAFAAQSCLATDSRAGGPPGFGRAKSCILIYLFGGPSHIDIWDMKPDAASSSPSPRTSRGFGSPSTSRDWRSGWTAWRSSGR
jgi:hypothetical protein